MRKEFEVLKKNVKVYGKDIDRIHNILIKYNNHKGIYESEMKRDKDRMKLQDHIIC